jgi:hypothetical protein
MSSCRATVELTSLDAAGSMEAAHPPAAPTTVEPYEAVAIRGPTEELVRVEIRTEQHAAGGIRMEKLAAIGIRTEELVGATTPPPQTTGGKLVSVRTLQIEEIG